MKRRLNVFLIIGGILLLGLAGLFLSSSFAVKPSETTEISTIKQSLLATTTPITKIAKRPIIKAATTTKVSVILPSFHLPATSTGPTSTTTAPASSSTIPDPPIISFDPQTLVGILCYFNATYTNENTGRSVYQSDDEEVRGSGVIINNRGNILTNRHIIQQPTSETTITDDNGNAIPISIAYDLDRCEVGQLPKGATLPTVDEIESINPYINIPVLGYTAQPIYVSNTAGLSDAEVQYADFAILGITGISSSGPTFGVTAVPNSFPFAKLLAVQSYPDIMNSQVLTYGFPGDVTSGQGNFFQTLTMTGSVGKVDTVYYGDQYYANVPLNISTDLAISHGRSGSPLIWRGYVIGIVTFFVGENQTNSGSVASDAIIQALENTNYLP